MRRLLCFSFICALLLLVIPLQAQDYATALQRIEEARLSGATSLDLSNSYLSQLPPEIGALTNLRHLELYANQLSTLPPELWQLTELESLNLSSNSFYNL